MKNKFMVIFMVISLLISASVWAKDDDEGPKLSLIHVNLNGEKWVKTDSARVIVSVDAILDKEGLAQTHKTINKNLSKIALDVEWHITQFNRMKDSSGLEKVRVEAEARINESGLPGLRDRAEKVSRPGEKFRIVNVDFTPSLADMERTREQLRDELYDKANKELERINKVYSKQNYFVYSVQFGGMPMPLKQQQPVYRAEMMAVSAAPADSGLQVSNKVQQSVYVVFGSIVK